MSARAGPALRVVAIGPPPPLYSPTLCGRQEGGGGREQVNGGDVTASWAGEWRRAALNWHIFV